MVALCRHLDWFGARAAYGDGAVTVTESVSVSVIGIGTQTPKRRCKRRSMGMVRVDVGPCRGCVWEASCVWEMRRVWGLGLAEDVHCVEEKGCAT